MARSHRSSVGILFHQVDTSCIIAKRGSHRATVTLLCSRCFWWHTVCNVSCYGTQRFITVLNGCRNGIRCEIIVHGLIYHPVATEFAARSSTCVQSVAKNVNVESSVEKSLQITKYYKTMSSTLLR